MTVPLTDLLVAIADIADKHLLLHGGVRSPLGLALIDDTQVPLMDLAPHISDIDL